MTLGSCLLGLIGRLEILEIVATRGHRHDDGCVCLERGPCHLFM